MNTQGISWPAPRFISKDFRNEFVWALIVVFGVAILATFVSWQVSIFALIFAVIAWWTWQNPQEALLLFIITAPLLPMFKATQTIGTITLFKDVLIGTLFLRLFLWPLITKQLPYRRNVLLLPFIALGFWLVIDTLRAPQLTLAILRLRDIGLYALLYFAVLYMPTSKKWYRTLITWFLISVVITMWLAVYQWWQAADSSVLRYDPARQIWIPRISSTFGHPSVFGEYLITVITLVISLLISQVKNTYKWVLGIVATASLPLIYLTYSRGVWLGLVAAFATMGATLLIARSIQVRKYVLNWKLWAAGLVAVIVVSIGVIRFTSVGTFLSTAFDPTYASNQDRLQFTFRLLSSVDNVSGLIGKGLGNVVAQNFREASITSYDIATGASRTVQVAKDSTLVDNQHLKTFVEMGFFGLLIYGWIYWLVGKNAWSLIGSSDRRARIIGLWGIGFLTAFIIQGIFVDIWDIFPTNAIFWIIAALTSSQKPLLSKK